MVRAYETEILGTVGVGQRVAAYELALSPRPASNRGYLEAGAVTALTGLHTITSYY